MKVIHRALIFLTVMIILLGCEPEEKTQYTLVPHTVHITSLAPKVGGRVQIDVEKTITFDQCRKLILTYRKKAVPDGQVSVHMPSKLLEGKKAPYCVDNFDSTGIQEQKTYFE